MVPEQVVILADVSDPLTDGQAKVVNARLEEVFASLKDYGKISIFFLTQNKDDGQVVLGPRLELCRPPSGENADEWTMPVSKMRRRFKQRFQDVVDDFLAQEAFKGKISTSPLAENISVIISYFDKHNIKNYTENRFIIISDLIENTRSTTNQYLGLGLSPSKLVKLHDPALAKSEISVYVLLIERDRHRILGIGKHQKFWQEYFDLKGIMSTAFELVKRNP
ncbi:MAG: hypothetical protein ACPGNT_01690 [Rhodospirillales bacterium]